MGAIIMEGDVGTPASGVIAQVDPAADTETKICTLTAPFDLTIKELNWTFGNLVNAKAATGYLEVKTSTGKVPYRYPIGFGVGGATNASNQKKASLDVAIPIDKGEVVDFYMTLNEAAEGAFIGFKFDKGKTGRPTHGDCNTVEDAAVSADTLTDFTEITIPPGMSGRIKKILVAYANVVDAKSVGGYVDLGFSESKGRHRYVVGGGVGGAATTSHSCAAEEIDVDIPINAGDVVTPKLYLAEAAVNAHVGIVWV